MSEEQIKELYKITPESIYGFFGDHRFLSNFHLCSIDYEGIIYPHSEAAFQAAKTLNIADRTLFVNMSPAESKKAGRKLNLRPDWEAVKIPVMKEILRIKFNSNPDLKAKLLATKDKYLEETNWWHDTFWGICNGKGENHLGKALMDIRKEFQT